MYELLDIPVCLDTSDPLFTTKGSIWQGFALINITNCFTAHFGQDLSPTSVLVTRVFDNPMGFKKNPRQAALAGHWDGTVHQEGEPGDYHITFQLKPTGRTVRGEGSVSYISQNTNITEPLTFFGGLVHDRFLKLEYEMEAQPGSVQFGFTLLELSPNGQTLSGPFLGYGARTRDFTKGTLELHRQRVGAIPHASSSSQKTI